MTMMLPATATIKSRLRGKFVRLSMNRHASHVVEDLLKFSEEIDAYNILLEIMDSPEFLNVLQDPFGNYVAQRALQYSKVRLYHILPQFQFICQREYYFCQIILVSFQRLGLQKLF